MKKVLVYFFILFLLLGCLLTVFTKDKSISEMENKILAAKPILSLKSVFDKSFMENAELYVSDQFPFRFQFVKLKDEFEYLVGKREFKGIYVGKNHRLIEKYELDEDVLTDNIKRINKIASDNRLDSKLIVIPNSIEFYTDELPGYALYDSQNKAIDIVSKESSIDYYFPIEILNKHKNEYIYFKTDHHWTQLGARYVYEDLYNKYVKGDMEMVSSDFYGTYYSKAPILSIKPDSIFAYMDYGKAYVEYDYNEKSNSLYDKEMLIGKNKYRFFLNGDPALAKIEGKGVNEVLIFKDSYAHNFIPFLVQEYSVIHIIDPRYYNGSISTYLKYNPNIESAIFFHNMSTISNTSLYRNIVK